MQETETQSNHVIRVRVSDLLFALQKRWMIIVALSLVGFTFGLILSAMTVVQSSYQTYTISGSFAVTSKNVYGKYVGGYDAPNINDFHLAEDMVDAVRYVLRSDHVLNEVINQNELLGYTIPQLRNAITVTQYNTTQVLEMKIVWRNAEEGVALWNAIVETASGILPETLQLGSLAIINEPQAEQIGVVGSGSNKVVLLTILGFSAGIGYAIIELLMHPTLNNVRDVETLFGLETIGVIPRDTDFYKRKGSIMTQEDVGNSVVVQNFSAAAYILRNRLGNREAHHCFYVTSAGLGEGKTTVAANLAIQLSDMEHRVLLIDFDTRNPRLGALFLNKVDYAQSLNALYRGDATEEEAITTLSGYLDLLPAVLEHNAISVDSTLIELVEKLKQNYEYVILDAPPVGVVSGTLSLNQVANTVLFVIGYDSSSLPEIQSSLEKLYKSGTRVLGCVVNNVVSGRSLGLSQTADDYKRSIGQKAREKKEKHEKYGFEDDGRQAPAVKRKGRRAKSSGKNASADPPRHGGDGGARIAVRRNVYEDTLDRPVEKPAPVDEQSVVQELVKIGLDGNWESNEQSAAAQPIKIENTATPPETPASEAGEILPAPAGPAPVSPRAEAEQTGLPSGESALPDSPHETLPHTAAPAPEPVRDNARKASAPARGRKKAGAKLPLFLLLALPVTLAGILLVLAVSAGILAAAAASGAFCGSCFLSALTAMTLLEEKLIAIGTALISLAVSLLLFRLTAAVPARGIPALVRAAAACCRRWCYGEDVR